MSLVKFSCRLDNRIYGDCDAAVSFRITSEQSFFITIRQIRRVTPKSTYVRSLEEWSHVKCHTHAWTGLIFDAESVKGPKNTPTLRSSKFVSHENTMTCSFVPLWLVLSLGITISFAWIPRPHHVSPRTLSSLSVDAAKPWTKRWSTTRTTTGTTLATSSSATLEYNAERIRNFSIIAHIDHVSCLNVEF